MKDKIKLYFLCGICLFNILLFGFIFVASTKDLNIFAMIISFLILLAAVILLSNFIKGVEALNKPIIAGLGALNKDRKEESYTDKEKRLFMLDTKTQWQRDFIKLPIEGIDKKYNDEQTK